MRAPFRGPIFKPPALQVVVDSKSSLPKGAFSIEKELEQIDKEYDEEDENGKFRSLELRNTHKEFGKHNRRNLWYPFYVNNVTGQISLEKTDGCEKILPVWDDGFEGCWTWGVPKATNELDFLIAKKVKQHWKIYVKDYADGSTRMLKTILADKDYRTEIGQKEFNKLFNTNKKVFQSPKSPYLLSTILQTRIEPNESDIILDFFSGSATVTKHK